MSHTPTRTLVVDAARESAFRPLNGVGGVPGPVEGHPDFPDMTPLWREAGVTVAEVDQFADTDIDNGGGGADATTNTIAAGDIVTALNTANVTLQATNNIDINSAIDASAFGSSVGASSATKTSCQAHSSAATSPKQA